MRQRLTVAVLVSAFMAVTGFAVDAAGGVRHEYAKIYVHVQKCAGHRAPGRNIEKWGNDDKSPATNAQLKKSLAVLKRMCAPQLQPTSALQGQSSQSGSTESSASSGGSTSNTAHHSYSGGGGGGGLPACASESGTDYSTGPANTNGSSGATGRYQIIPSTHAALCSDLGWSPGEQDQCASRIYGAQGSGAWVGCGG